MLNSTYQFTTPSAPLGVQHLQTLPQLKIPTEEVKAKLLELRVSARAACNLLLDKNHSNIVNYLYFIVSQLSSFPTDATCSHVTTFFTTRV